MKNRFLIFSISLTLVHTAATWFCIFVANFLGFQDLNEPPAKVSLVFTEVAKILLLPGRLVWGNWMYENMLNFLELLIHPTIWLAFLANSCLWGFGIASIWMRSIRRT